MALLVCQANSVIEWDNMCALMSSRLFALDKCPSVHPIVTEEALHRILGKTIAMITRCDLKLVCSADQLCSCLHSELEGAIHTVQKCFADRCGQG